jgi:hypothetical protein
MRLAMLIVVPALGLLVGCASSLPAQDFRSAYQNAAGRSVKIEGYPPFNVAELRDQRRLKVELNILAQAFGGLADPLVLLGFTDGIPPASAHRAAARAYMAETGRPSCNVADAAVLPNGRAFEFRYDCRAGA